MCRQLAGSLQLMMSCVRYCLHQVLPVQGLKRSIATGNLHVQGAPVFVKPNTVGTILACRTTFIKYAEPH
jgi:hypothetical protein